MSNEISQIFKEALNPNLSIRQLAEHKINQLAEQNFSNFLLSCATELSDESKPKETRQLSSTLIKNLILISPLFQGRWITLPLDEKQTIKSLVMSTLASNDKDIRKAAALVVAGIF